MAKFHIEPDQVSKAAHDVTSLAQGVHEMSSYTGASELKPEDFGKVAGDSDRAQRYVGMMNSLGQKLQDVEKFLDDYSSRLTATVKMHAENEAESAWGINTAGKDV